MKLPIAIAALLLSSSLHAAELADNALMIKLMDDYGLHLQLIDARRAAQESTPLAGAVVYRATTRARPGYVLVIGDSDDQALAVAAALEKRDSGVRTFVATGGAAAYEAARDTYLNAPVEDASSYGFVIPRDTCQPGEPAHVFEAQ
jgi:hypothetical protein